MSLKQFSALSRLSLFVFLLPLMAAMTANAFAQDSITGGAPVLTPKRTEPEKEQTTKIYVKSSIVSAPVTVLDSSGHFVYDLEQKDFKVLDDGVPQNITLFEPAVDPVAVVVVVQVNDAVAALLDQVKPVGSLISGLMLGEKGQAAVIFFADKAQVVQGFSSSSDQLEKTLGTVRSYGGGEHLNDALARAIALLELRPQAERRVILAFSDGFDRGSETTSDEVVRHATNAGVTIYGLGFSPTEAILKKKPEYPGPDIRNEIGARPGPPGVVPSQSVANDTYNYPVPPVSIVTAAGEVVRSTLVHSPLERYAGYTGGVFYSHWSKTKLQDQLSDVASEVQSQYELAYVPTTLDQKGFHPIEIEVDRPGVKVRARAGYFTEEENEPKK